MFYDEVEKIIDYVFDQATILPFTIGMNPVKEFVKFHIIAEYLQEEVFDQSQSIKTYVENEIEKDKTSYKVKSADVEEKLRWQKYERTIDIYHTLNEKKQLEYIKKLEEEKKYRENKDDDEKLKTVGNPARYNGYKLYEYQLNEFKILKAIKNGDYDTAKANLTYKRLMSKRKIRYKISFKNYSDYVDILRTEIDERSNDPYKNIAYYKLEKRMNHELNKSVAAAINQCARNGERQEVVANDLFRLYVLPLIKDRQTYAEMYPKLDAQERIQWRKDIFSLEYFIKYLVSLFKEFRKDTNLKEILTDDDMEKFKLIFAKGTFENSYIQRRDFSADDFRAIMSVSDEMNEKAWNNIK